MHELLFSFFLKQHVTCLSNVQRPISNVQSNQTYSYFVKLTRRLRNHELNLSTLSTLIKQFNYAITDLKNARSPEMQVTTSTTNHANITTYI
jgi:hypothetical protein